MRITSLFLLFLILSSACKKEAGYVDCTTECSNPGFGIEFKGYMREEVDTVIVRKYTNDSTFTTMVSEQNYIIDTSILDHTLYIKNFLMKAGFDYELVLPAVTDTYRISRARTTDVKQERRCKEGHIRYIVCYNTFNYDELLIQRNSVTDTLFTFMSYNEHSRVIRLRK